MAALEAVLAVPGSHEKASAASSAQGASAGEEGSYCARVKACAARECGLLDERERAAAKAERECQATLSVLSVDIEKWARRKLEAPNKEQVETEREREWARENAAANEAALRLLRSFMPVDLATLTAADLETRVAQKVRD